MTRLPFDPALSTRDRNTLAAKVASAVLWHEHWLTEGHAAAAASELEYARQLASELLGQPRDRAPQP